MTRDRHCQQRQGASARGRFTRGSRPEWVGGTGDLIAVAVGEPSTGRVRPIAHVSSSQDLLVPVIYQENGRICSGWAGCHPMEHSLGARLALFAGHLTGEQYAELLEYSTSVELFDSGRRAAEHGLAADPSPETVTLRRKLDEKLRQTLAQVAD